jgi:hypothetical protein
VSGDASYSAKLEPSDLERERGDGVEQQLRDRLVDAVAGGCHAARRVLLDVLVDAQVIGHDRVASLVIADAHPPPAASADRESLLWRSSTATKLDSLALEIRHASRLRRKLRDVGEPGLLINVWGVGYRLSAKTTSSAVTASALS